ncbi:MULTISPECIES: helix-turn-helix domain-containing protein [unclassified Mucilaginibacter]|uniref:helix-turn-helix domain-containing protein n=1 Tax=unclassified Mucilaginibacter TaxID=2617802 RepID=UPI003390A166
MILHIKNMVCDRCLMVVRQQLENLHFQVTDLVLGKATIDPDPDESHLLEIGSSLKLMGFELIDSEKQQIVERIKNLVIQQVHYTDLSKSHINFSDLLSSQLFKDYAYLSRLFSEYEDITIEKFIIQQKVEKVKELLEYGQANLNEIAFQMGYSSSAHLSAQFKNVTGLTPSQYKTGEKNERKSLDKI